MRIAILAVLMTLGFTAPAQATIAWIDTRTDAVRVAEDDGTSPRSLGPGDTPQVSPDGRLVAFRRVTAGTLDGELVLAPVDGSAPPRRLALSAYALAFTPDGGRVVGVDTRRSVLRLVSIPVAGGPAVALLETEDLLGLVVGFPDPATVTLSLFEDDLRARVGGRPAGRRCSAGPRASGLRTCRTRSVWPARGQSAHGRIARPVARGERSPPRARAELHQRESPPQPRGLASGRA